MGREKYVVKDRQCFLCGETRARTAEEVKAHVRECFGFLRAHVQGGGNIDTFREKVVRTNETLSIGS